MIQFWNDVDVAEIKAFGNSGGRFDDAYFEIFMNDGSRKEFRFPNYQELYRNKYELKEIYNSYHNVPESYSIENKTYIEVNGGSEHFGYSVKDNVGRSIKVTKLQALEFKKQCKLIDTGYYYAVYSCVGKIEFGKIISGRVDDDFIDQLRDLGYEFPVEKGIYKNGEKVENVK